MPAPGYCSQACPIGKFEGAVALKSHVMQGGGMGVSPDLDPGYTLSVLLGAPMNY